MVSYTWMMFKCSSSHNSVTYSSSTKLVTRDSPLPCLKWLTTAHYISWGRQTMEEMDASRPMTLSSGLWITPWNTNSWKICSISLPISLISTGRSFFKPLRSKMLASHHPDLPITTMRLKGSHQLGKYWNHAMLRAEQTKETREIMAAEEATGEMKWINSPVKLNHTMDRKVKKARKIRLTKSRGNLRLEKKMFLLWRERLLKVKTRGKQIAARRRQLNQLID